MYRTMMRHEWRLLRREPTLWWAGGVLLLAIAYALISGLAWQQTRTEEMAATLAETHELLSQQRETAAEEGARVGSARSFIPLPPGPLAAFSTGLADLSPQRAEISVWKRPDTLFGRYQLESPLSLLAGRFDLAFVILYLLPLFILALSYNLLSTEREGGTLALVLMQPVRLADLLVAKLLTRLALVTVLLVGMIGATALAAGVGVDSLPRLLGWFAVAWLYCGFWLAIAALVASLVRRSEASAATLAAIWLVVVLVLPGALNLGVQAASPVPSRLEFVTEMRAASSEAAKQSATLLAQYYHEHPELAANGQQGGFMPAYYASQRQVDDRLAPLIEDFERRLTTQQGLVERWRFASPAVLAQEAFLDLAGSSLRRQREFSAQARAFLAAWHEMLGPKIFLGEDLIAEDFDLLPTFTFAEVPVSRRRFFGTLAGLALPSFLALVLARRRLTQTPVA